MSLNLKVDAQLSHIKEVLRPEYQKQVSNRISNEILNLYVIYGDFPSCPELSRSL